MRQRCSVVGLREDMVGRGIASEGTDHQVAAHAFPHWLCTRNLRPAPIEERKVSR